jgi:hypothetical protein
MDTPPLDPAHVAGGHKYRVDDRVVNILFENRRSERFVFEIFYMIKRLPYFFGFSIRQKEKAERRPERFGKCRSGIFVTAIQLIIPAIPCSVFYGIPTPRQ